MNLAPELISQFAKLTTEKKKEKKERTVYGTIVESNGTFFVRFDGSNSLTPVVTTVDVEDGERVTVQLKNHTATVTGNLTSPSARITTVRIIGDDLEQAMADMVYKNAYDEDMAAVDARLKAVESAEIGEIAQFKTETNQRLDDVESDITTIKQDITDLEESIDIQSIVTETVTNIMEQKATIISAAYPVGSLYMSTIETNPETLFGFGTWERIQDTFLLASGEKYTAGTTGGEETHTLTSDEMPIHKHTTHSIGIGSSYRDNTANGYAALRSAGLSEQLGSSNSITDETGGGEPHNNMPPYLAVYVWKRTA